MMMPVRTKATAVMMTAPMATLSTTAAFVGRLFRSVLWWVRDGIVAHLLVTTSCGRGRSLTLGLGLLWTWTATVGKGTAVVMWATMVSATASSPGTSRASLAATAASKEWMFGDLLCLLFEASNKVPEGSGLVDITN
jgi:hypothetical protein